MLRVPEPSTMELLQRLLRYSATSRKNLSRENVRRMINTKFVEKERESLMNTLAEQWLEEGKEIGRKETLRTATLQLLQWKFALPETQVQRIGTLTLPQLEALFQTAFTIPGIHELQQWLDAQSSTGTTEGQTNN
jgi:hypothetical protein